MNVTVTPDPAFPAGHAVVRIPAAAAAVDSPGFRIQREEDWEDDKLGPTGWQSSDALLTPDRAEASGADLLLHVGWPVCRHLEAGVYTLEVPASGQGAAAVFWPDIVPMHAGAVDVNTRPVAPEPPPPPPVKPPPVKPPPILKPAPVMTPVAPPPIPPVEPALDTVIVRPPPPGVPRLGLMLPALLLLLLVLGGAGYYLWTHRGGEPAREAEVTPPAPPTPAPTPPIPTPPIPTPPPAPPPVSLAGLSVPDVVAKAPNPAAITAEGLRRLQGDRHDDGLVLLEEAADKGDPAAAAALARLYDPVLFQPGGPIPKADPRQAARYYRDAARAGVDVSAAREALRHSLEARAQSGDLGANLSLKDFWP